MTTINVQGSTGNTYKVIVKDDKYTCNCKSFFYRKRCKHIDNIRLEKNNAMNSKTNGSVKNGNIRKVSIVVTLLPIIFRDLFDLKTRF